MKLQKTRALVALTVAVTLLLAACGQQTPQAVEEGSVRLTLTVAADALSSQSLTTQGSPFVPATGATAIEVLHVTVRDRSDQVVNFDMDGSTYVASADGDVDFVTLTKTAPADGFESAEVVLPFLGNPYTFETLGYYDVTEPVIAYASQVASVSDASTVLLQPVSVVGTAQLASRLPLNFALPGSVVDLMLVVTANGNDDLRVPLGDFEATYLVANEATVLATSNRGIRLQISEQCTTPFAVNGSVGGLVEVGGSFITGSIEMNGSDGFVVVCPPLTDSGLAYDSEPPSVSITNHVSASGLVEGTAEDNAGIAKIQLFDGPMLVASTDEDEATSPVALIEFGLGSTAFTTTLEVDPVAGLVAFAFDTTGNQSADGSYLGQQFGHCPANTNWYVSSLSGYNDEATAAPGTPFATIQAAINAAADGDVLCVAPGTYAVDNSGRGTGQGSARVGRINKPLTLIGPNAGVPGHAVRGPEARIVTSSTEGDWLLGFSVESSDVTVDGFYITTDTPKSVYVDHYSFWGFYVTAGAVENVTISNNRVVNANRPIWINRGRTADGATGFVVEGNLIEGPQQISEQAIVLQSAAGSILNNVIRDTRVGMQVVPYGQGGNGVVADNDIEASQNGLWFNYLENPAALWLFESNEVVGVASPQGWPLLGEDPTLWSGIRIETFIGGEVTFTNNVVSAGAADPGTGNAYLVRQRSNSGGTVTNIGTDTELGSFFTSNTFPEFSSAVTVADLSVDNDLLQLVAPTP